MAKASISTGEVNTGYEKFNEAPKPVEPGSFALSRLQKPGISDLLKSIDRTGADYIVKYLDADAELTLPVAAISTVNRVRGGILTWFRTRQYWNLRASENP